MSETGQPKVRQPGEDDDLPLPPGFIDELRRLDSLRDTKPQPETKDE